MIYFLFTVANKDKANFVPYTELGEETRPRTHSSHTDTTVSLGHNEPAMCFKGLAALKITFHSQAEQNKAVHIKHVHLLLLCRGLNTKHEYFITANLIWPCMCVHLLWNLKKITQIQCTLPVKNLRWLRFFNAVEEVSYVYQACIYLISTVKQ